MDKMEERTIKCAYQECVLPNTNAQYVFQTIYLLLGAFILLKNTSSFTFFALFMYVVPIYIDSIYCGLRGIVFKGIKTVFIVINTIVLFLCFLGFAGIIIDNGSCFGFSEESLILPGRSVEKVALVWPLLFELLIPVSLIFGSPTKRVKEAIEYVERAGGSL